MDIIGAMNKEREYLSVNFMADGVGFEPTRQVLADTTDFKSAPL